MIKMLEETFDQKKRRLFGKQSLQSYINTIEKLTTDSERCILSIVETDKILEKVSTLKEVFKTVLPFEDKTGLKNIVNEKFKSEDSIYLLTSLSRDCGGIVINSIANFNFNFNFDDDSGGIFSLVSNDLKERILFDFYEENGKKFIEIEYFQ
ncbi:hypothetical protein LZF95_21070 [Algoriphagus sp. AGSA1]|uniref:Uncharacterized protein n=1 Tax=Arthrospiribacter ruber TaxID=2487934 RepID=A0A951MIF2_9BACT|nr:MULTISPECIES: hypothetical protein [Cyclobacteriaceae]MBW3469836.1 hypothetical protein [Arthrospiribacter ruber]MCE7057186.1 hypothetical protein [Algoriphagus sp. AGSA1]